MKQVLVKQGQVIVSDIPAPIVSDNGVLVKLWQLEQASEIKYLVDQELMK